MMPVIAIMLIGMTLCWMSQYKGVQHRSKVRAQLMAANRQVLSAGIILGTALMPAFRSSDARLLGICFFVESLIALSMMLTRLRWRSRIWRAWEASMQTVVKQMAGGEDGAPCETIAVQPAELRPVA